MPRGGFSAGSRKLELAVDTGNPLLNRTLDGFIKIGAVRTPSSSLLHQILRSSSPDSSNVDLSCIQVSMV